MFENRQTSQMDWDSWNSVRLPLLLCTHGSSGCKMQVQSYDTGGRMERRPAGTCWHGYRKTLPGASNPSTSSKALEQASC